MKNMAKLTVIGVLLGAGAIQSHAQTTNIVRGLNIALTAYVQASDGVVTIKRISTKDVIAAINIDQTNTVSTKTKLILSTPVGGSGFTVLLRTAGTADADVSSFFQQSQIGDSVTKGTGNNTTEYSIQSVAFHSSSLDFDVQGFTQSKHLSVRNGGPSSMDNIAASGIGDVGGSTAVLKGTLNTTGPKAEAVTP